MKITEITALGIRIFGIIFLLNLLSSFAAWYISINTSPEPAFSKAQILVTYILPSVISLIAIKFPVSLAKLLIPYSSQPSQDLETDGKAIQLAAFTILGVYILSYAIPDFIFNALMIISYNNIVAEIDKSPFYINEITTIVKLIIGLYLTLGSIGVLRLIARLRNTGTN